MRKVRPQSVYGEEGGGNHSLETHSDPGSNPSSVVGLWLLLCSHSFGGFLISTCLLNLPGTGLDLGDKPDIPPPFGADHLMRKRPQVCSMVDTPRSKTNRKGDELVSGGLGAAF